MLLNLRIYLLPLTTLPLSWLFSTGLDDDPHILLDVTGRSRPTVGKKDLGCYQSGVTNAPILKNVLNTPRTLTSNGASYVDYSEPFNTIPMKIIRAPKQKHPTHNTPDGVEIYGKEFGTGKWIEI